MAKTWKHYLKAGKQLNCVLGHYQPKMSKSVRWIEITIGLIVLGAILGTLLSLQNVATTTSLSTITSTNTTHSVTTYTSTSSRTFTATSTETLTKTLPVTVTSSTHVTVTTTVTSVQPSGEVVGVYFSPKGGCASQVAYWISRANSSVHILIYSFTLPNIGDELIKAKNRGVDVKVVFEKSQVSQYSQYFRLASADLDVRNDTNPDLMHDKVAIIDGYITITGSFNWSNAAENDNDENLVVIKSSDVAGRYETVFQRIWSSSTSAPTKTTTTSTTQQITVVIYEVHYDAAGDDWNNLNDEYVAIKNVGCAALSLTGWRLMDLAGHTFIFPGFSLNPGATVTVYTGSGTNTATALYWGSGSPIWNNDHDTAYLYDQNMNLIDKKSW